MADKVRCAECGFLTLRGFPSRELREADEPFRQERTVITTEKRYATDTVPLCFVTAADLAQEAGSDNADAVLGVMHRDRECQDFTPWTQGFSPGARGNASAKGAAGISDAARQGQAGLA